MQHGSGSKTYTKIYGLRSEQKRTFFNKKAKRARKDLTFPGGNETIRSNDEGRRTPHQRECIPQEWERPSSYWNSGESVGSTN